jgi:hypothetical protein
MGCKVSQGTNTLAYYSIASATEKKEVEYPRHLVLAQSHFEDEPKLIELSQML